MVEWLQVDSLKMNGIFRKFRIVIAETLADGSKGMFREIYGTNVTEKHVYSAQKASLHFDITKYYQNMSIQVNMTAKKFSLEFVGLRTYTNYSIGISACTRRGCGIAAEISTRTEESGE